MPRDEPEVSASFTPIDGRDLAPVAVVAQCLDNQWVRQDLLRRMIDEGRSITDRTVQKARAAQSRAEYLRALLNSEQVIVNRAFFFNNRVVYRDFEKSGPARDTVIRMLGDRVIVPFLLGEDSPGQPPAFTRDAKGWPVWRRLLGDTDLTCLRLSWDADENRDMVRELLVRPFRDFVGKLAFLDERGLQTDLGVPAEAVPALMERLRAATTWAMYQPEATREDFYREFVVADGSDPALGRYDRGKPFAGEIKQLVDLRYNTNLPDAVDRYPLTPADSLHRTALQEERRVLRAQPAADPAELVATLLRRRAFDLVQRPLAVPLTGLDLPAVWQARQTDDWHLYLGHLRGLLDHPDEFGVRAQQVYDSYVGLAGRLADAVGERRAGTAAVWEPVIKLVIDCLGASASIVFSDQPVMEITGEVADQVATRASTVVVRFVITHRDRRRASDQLATGIDIMRLKFAHTGSAWAELVGSLRASGLPVRESATGGDDDPAIDSLPEDDTR